MSEAALKFISGLLESLGIPYEFMEWTSEIKYPYFVGEYQEVESMTKEEDGFQETAFILTGFTRGSWLSLEEAKEKIEKGITKTATTEDGSAVAVFYGSSFPVPTGDDELKKIQINLTIKEWKVNK